MPKPRDDMTRCANCDTAHKHSKGLDCWALIANHGWGWGKPIDEKGTTQLWCSACYKAK